MGVDRVTGEVVSAMDVQRYTDLADLILPDPVQDVSGAGWPHE